MAVDDAGADRVLPAARCNGWLRHAPHEWTLDRGYDTAGQADTVTYWCEGRRETGSYDDVVAERKLTVNPAPLEVKPIPTCRTCGKRAPWCSCGEMNYDVPAERDCPACGTRVTVEVVEQTNYGDRRVYRPVETPSAVPDFGPCPHGCDACAEQEMRAAYLLAVMQQITETDNRITIGKMARSAVEACTADGYSAQEDRHA